jgi:lysophospholipase L1-like esterase
MNTFLLRKYVPVAALLGLGLTACQPDLEDDVKPSAGSANFTTYLAIGNSLTAGFSDNGLYLEGQQKSYPAILAQQFQQAGGGAFAQPLFPADKFNGSGFLKITAFTNGTPTLGQETANLATTSGSPLLARYTAADNQNLGVPGIRIADITTASYGRLTQQSNASNFNPYFERLLSGADSKTYLQYVQERVTALKPTFYTNWLGNNDVLGYASSGGTGAPLTTVAEFTTKYNQMMDVLNVNGAKGVVATIPNVTNVPLFTTVPTAAVIAQINATPIPAALVPIIAAQLGLPTGSSLPAGTRFGLYVRTSATGTGAVRQATANDLLLLPASSFINSAPVAPNLFPGGIGLVIPGAPAATAAALAATANAVPNNLVLDSDEVANATTRTTELNAVITASAQRTGAAVFNANTYFSGIATTGVITNGVVNSTAFVSGNLFSLDGVHPTPRGYALVANEMIKVINQQYGSRVALVNPNDYRGVRFP